MSVAAVTWALYEVRDVSPADKLALVVLAEHAAPDGTGSWPSWKRIAEVAGVSRRTVARTMDGLEKRGLIRRGDQNRSVEALRAAGKDPRWAPVVWDLVMDGSHSVRAQRGLPPVLDEDRDAHRGGASPQAGRGVSLAPQSVDQRLGRSPSAIVPGQRGCQSDTPPASTPTKACHPGHSSSAIGDTQNQEKNQETTTSHDEAVRSTGGVVVDSDEGAAELAAAIHGALPQALRDQLSLGVLVRKCADLASLGWTAADLSKATVAHSWAGAGPGAVVAWARDLKAQPPPNVLRAGSETGRRRAVDVERQRLARLERERMIRASPEACAARAAARQELARLLHRRREESAEVRAANAGGIASVL